jgi:hypothetical protein
MVAAPPALREMAIDHREIWGDGYLPTPGQRPRDFRRSTICSKRRWPRGGPVGPPTGSPLDSRRDKSSVVRDLGREPGQLRLRDRRSAVSVGTVQSEQVSYRTSAERPSMTSGPT